MEGSRVPPSHLPQCPSPSQCCQEQQYLQSRSEEAQASSKACTQLQRLPVRRPGHSQRKAAFVPLGLRRPACPPLGSRESGPCVCQQGARAALWLRLPVVSVLAPGGGICQPVRVRTAFAPASQCCALGALHRPQSAGGPVLRRTAKYSPERQNWLPPTTVGQERPSGAVVTRCSPEPSHLPGLSPGGALVPAASPRVCDPLLLVTPCRALGTPRNPESKRDQWVQLWSLPTQPPSSPGPGTAGAGAFYPVSPVTGSH